jgi:hypothetical protein
VSKIGYWKDSPVNTAPDPVALREGAPAVCHRGKLARLRDGGLGAVEGADDGLADGQ